MTTPSLITVALLAYSMHEHQEGHVHHVDVWIDGDRLVIEDDGRGMGLDRPGYVAGLLGTLNGESGWVQLHGVGLSLVAIHSPRMTIESVRPTGMWRQSFSFGVAETEATSVLMTRERGSRWDVRLPRAMDATDVAVVSTQLRRWASSHPTCRVELHTGEQVNR